MSDPVTTTTIAAPAVEILGVSISLFWIGVVGSLSVELAAFAGHYDTASGKHPEKYKKLGFYVVRLFLAFVGGVLVVVYGVTTAPAALQIGASASALVLALAKQSTPPPQ